MNYFKKLLTKKKKKPKPVLYDEHGTPIFPIRSNKDLTIRHKFQQPSIFNDEETDEILQKESIKGKELK